MASQHWSLYEDFPVKGFEKTVQVINSAVSDYDRSAAREAREALSLKGIYKNELLPDSLLFLCRKGDGYYNVSVLHKKNPELAEQFAEKIRERI